MGKYAFIVAASENYLLGMTAMLNSLKAVGSTHDVILLSHKLPDMPVTIQVETEVEHQVEGTAIERFRFACDYIDRYDAICLLDADMFFLEPVDLYFDIASKGFIVTGSNGMIIDFHKGYQEQYSIDLGSESYPYFKTHTTVPIFINKENIHWFKQLYETRPGFAQWDDFLYLNILGIKLGMDKKMLCLPPYTFTGIHHWYLKPAIRVIRKGGKITSGTEQPIVAVHGKWWDEGWYKDLMLVMNRYCKDAECVEGAEKSRILLMNAFEGFLL